MGTSDRSTTHLPEGMIELSTSECWQLLRQSEVGRLAISISDHPDIFPVNYVVDGESVVFRTAAGTKLAAAVLGNAVAFEIDGYEPFSGNAWSVVLKGTAREIEHMMEYFEAEELPLFPWNAAPKPNIVRIEPVEVTGRRFHVVEPEEIEAPPPSHTEPYMPPD
jgi:nitroimidazol reductase NimA-like FMN-containing flavoprotein (pyridoxamine 5'-phosphate oxidase superfamily)